MDDRTDIESLARTMADRLRDLRDADIMDSGMVEELAWHEATALQIADMAATQANAKEQAEAIKRAVDGLIKALEPTLPKPPKEDPLIKAHAKEVLNYYNERSGRSLRGPGHLGLIAKVLRAKYTVEDCCKVIDHKHNEWASDQNMAKYFDPRTLFRTVGRFEAYLASATDPITVKAAPSMYRDWRND